MKSIPVNKIIDFSAVDGVGNRTSVFLQGCNLRCIYCHNPETIQVCINCGQCVSSCPVQALCMQDGQIQWQKTACIECDACIKQCPHLASPRVIWMTADEIANHIVKNIPFIRGVTVSGGECTLYHEKLLILFKKLKQYGLTCFIDHNGTFDFRENIELLNVTDGVLFDAKAMDKQTQMQITGYENPNLLQNLKYLIKENKLQEVRTVIAEDPTLQSQNTVTEVSRFLAMNAGKDVVYKLIKYRPFGVRGKYRSILPPSDNTMKEMLNIAKRMGLSQVIII